MKHKDIFVQETPSSCGACSIASIISYYGGYVPLDIILEDTGTDKNGTSALKLKNALEHYGFDSYGFKTSLKNLKNYSLPVISHISRDGYEHFLVVYKIYDDRIETMDPAYGKKVYTKKEFESMSTSNYINATPRGVIPKYAHSKSILNLLSPLIKNCKFKTFLICFLAIIILGLNVVISFHLKLFNMTNEVLTLCSIFIILELLIGLIEYGKFILLGNMVKYVDDSSLHRFTCHIFHLPLKILKNRRVGEIMRKIEDMSFVKDLFLKLTIETPIDIFTLILVLSLMVSISLKLTAIYLFMILIYIFITILSNKTIYKGEHDFIRFKEDYTGLLVEYLDGLESIKNLNGEEKFLNDLDKSFKKFTQVRYQKDKRFASIDLLKSRFFNIGLILVDAIGFLMIGTTFTFIDLLTIGSLFSIFYASCERVTSIFIETSKFKALLRSISEFYDLKKENRDPYLKESLNKLKIVDLSFSYNRLDYTLKNFNYVLKCGESVLIKGPSGIGKSTLVKCLAGQDRDYEGKIEINGYDIKNLGADYVKKNIIYIGQEEKLFTKTIEENVTLGVTDTSLFKHVSELSKLSEIIKDKREHERTMLLEGASNLSGGERSRLILARALYRCPRVLIIDETLSSIGEDDENEIIKNLLSLNDISIIYITHRNKEKYFKNIIEFRKDGNYEIRRNRTIEY